MLHNVYYFHRNSHINGILMIYPQTGNLIPSVLGDCVIFLHNVVVAMSSRSDHKNITAAHAVPLYISKPCDM